MSALSARFSSSSRSMRSMNDLSCSPAIPPTSGIRSPFPVLTDAIKPQAGAQASVLRLRSRKRRLLFRRRFLLMLFAPFVVRHAVDNLARLGVRQSDPTFLGRRAIPFRQTVAAEPGEVHQVDVLHIGALAQMRDKRAKCRGLQLGAGPGVNLVGTHLGPPLPPPDVAPPYVASEQAILNGSRAPRRGARVRPAASHQEPESPCAALCSACLPRSASPPR